MKVYTSTNDYGTMPATIREHVEKALGGALGVFDDLLGGDVFELEAIVDLEQIVVDYDNGGTAADTVAPMDNAELLGDYAVLFYATNDSGGPCYFVPKWMVDNCIIVQSIIRATTSEHLRMAEENGQVELSATLKSILAHS